MQNPNIIDILVIEDDLNDLGIIMEGILKGNDRARVVHMPISAGALEVIFGNSTGDRPIEQLKLILLSTNYRNGSVIDVLKKIRTKDQTRHTPIVIFSSSNLHNRVSDAYLTGANSYIIKPTETTNYIDTVSQLAYYWSNINQGLSSVI